MRHVYFAGHRFDPLLMLLVLCMARTARAGLGPENTAVVINADSPASRMIANEYIRLRQIPASNVVMLSGIAEIDTIDVELFRTTILEPIVRTLHERGVWEQINAIAYSADFPCAVDVRADLGGMQERFPTASITGLTYLGALTMAKNPAYLGLSTNFYCRQPLRPRDTEPWTDEQRTRYASAVQMMQEKKYAEAEPLLATILAAHPNFDQALYNHACCLALLGRADEAMRALQRATECGWSDANHTASDADLESLRARADFQALLNRLRHPPPITLQPTLGMRGGMAFDRAGEVVATDKGVRYMLSTMLAYTTGRGNSVNEALTMLRRSAQADGTKPAGTICYMTNGDVRSTTRRWGFESAVSMLRELGVKAEIIDGTIPQGRRDIAGLMAGTASFDWAGSGSTVLPGAICEHLTSFGGVMRENAGQTPLSDFISAGASGASGTVVEPFAIQAKFPTPFMHVHYARGCTLAEAFYQSVSGPYQLLIVGDPLCAPWADPPAVRVAGVQPRQTVRGEIELRPTVTGSRARDIAVYELYIDGIRRSEHMPGDPITLDTTTLSDGWHELRVVAVTSDAIATPGGAIVPIYVNNGGRRVVLTVRGRPKVDQQGTLLVQARAEGAASIRIEHHGVRLAAIGGERGEVTIRAADLGPGVSMLRAVAVWPGDDRAVSSEPIEITVDPGPIFEPVRLGRNANLADGVLLTPQAGSPAVVESTREHGWLRNAGVKPGQSFGLDGVVRVDADDLYQVQVRSPDRVTLSVNGVETPLTGAPGGWRFALLALKAGHHSFRLNVEVLGAPDLEVRFGNRGSRSWAGPRFKHLSDR